MKTIMLIIISLLIMTGCNAQSTVPKAGTEKTKVTNCVKTSDGNFVAKTTAGKTATPPKATGKTYTDNDSVKYPIYIGAKGGMFILKVSKKTGKEYRQYLQADAK